MSAVLPSDLLAYLSEARTEGEIYAHYDGRATRSEVLDTFLYLAGRGAIAIEPGTNAKRWVRSAKARAMLARMGEGEE